MMSYLMDRWFCKIPLIAMALMVTFLPETSLAQDAATGTMLAAAMETVGYTAQSQVLAQLSSMLENAAGLIYLCTIIAAVFSVSVSGKYDVALWLLVGPPLFVYLSGVEINGTSNRTSGGAVVWQFGTFTDSDKDKDKVVVAQSGSTQSNVSFFFHKYNQLISEGVQEIIKVVTNDSVMPQMLFMARQRVLEDLFDLKANDSELQALIAYFLAQCNSEINYARLVGLGTVDSVFREEPEYEYAKQQYCERWPFRDKPFTDGPWQKYAVANGFWNHYAISTSEHTEKMTQATGVVSCADMWSWIVLGAVKTVKEEVDQKVVKNVDPYALKIAGAAAGSQSVPEKVKEDVEKILTENKGGHPNVRQPLSDPCPSANSSFTTASQSFDFGKLDTIVASRMIRKSITQSPAEQLLTKVMSPSGVVIGDMGRSMTNADAVKRATVVRRAKAQQLGETTKFETYAFVMLLPYVQGLILYTLATLYPFFAMVVLVPGKAGAFFNWMAIWAWAKSWDIGYAFVMVADQILWELMPKSAFYNMQNDEAYGSPISLLQGAFNGDHAYNLATYWMLLGTMMLAVPLVTAKGVLGAKAAMCSTFIKGVQAIGAKYGGSAGAWRSLSNSIDAVIAGDPSAVGSGDMAKMAEVATKGLSVFNAMQAAERDRKNVFGVSPVTQGVSAVSNAVKGVMAAPGSTIKNLGQDALLGTPESQPFFNAAAAEKKRAVDNLNAKIETLTVEAAKGVDKAVGWLGSFFGGQEGESKDAHEETVRSIGQAGDAAETPKKGSDNGGVREPSTSIYDSSRSELLEQDGDQLPESGRFSPRSHQSLERTKIPGVQNYMNNNPAMYLHDTGQNRNQPKPEANGVENSTSGGWAKVPTPPRQVESEVKRAGN